ncbi:hypothetical protein GX48_07483 [Paracoccidioides brasiliensis]|nr:hypothetical protein GX48_07483 [Paracoccidioides brasiliensis]
MLLSSITVKLPNESQSLNKDLTMMTQMLYLSCRLAGRRDWLARAPVARPHARYGMAVAASGMASGSPLLQHLTPP